MRLPLLVALVLLAAGCVAAPEPTPSAELPAGQNLYELEGGLLFHAHGARANLGFLHHAEGPDATLTFPPGVLVQGEDGRLLPAAEPVAFAQGAQVWFLPPYGVTNLSVEVDAGGAQHTLTVALDDGAHALFAGETLVDLLKVQRDQFPNRSPGMPNYEASMDYFAAFFEELGYEVAIESYAHAPGLPLGASPASFNNVVAYKRGTMTPERYLVFGGHFDVVEQTRDGAFDNTAGTLATLVMAEAFANVSTEHTLVFAAWGGEEDGILGSQAWLTRHPDLVPFIDGYFNYDVTGLVWPAPKVEPSALVVSAGPDGPVADTLLARAQSLVGSYIQTEAEYVYEPMAEGQAQGAGVNAQSDHTPFAMRGIPAYFTFTHRVDDVLALIHSELDTVDNLTKYALYGIEAMANENPLAPEEIVEGEHLLARSFEVQLALGFYWAILTDAGVFGDPRVPVPTAEGVVDDAKAFVNGG